MSAHGSTYVRSILGLALSSQVVGGKTVRYITHPSGTNIGYVAPEGQAWFLTDRLGTVIALASDAGSIIATYSYDPTGIPRATVENGTVAGYNIHRYHGGLLDKTTGLTRFGVRWYNPAMARFTTPDPSGKEKNTYLYVSGNTCNMTDLSGEYSWSDCGWMVFKTTVAGAIGGAVTGAVATFFGGGLGAGPGAAVGAAGGFTTSSTGCILDYLREEFSDAPRGGEVLYPRCSVNPSTGAYSCRG